MKIKLVAVLILLAGVSLGCYSGNTYGGTTGGVRPTSQQPDEPHKHWDPIKQDWKEDEK